MERYTRALFQRGTEIASKKGLILVDTKYEFGKREGKVILIDDTVAANAIYSYAVALDVLTHETAHAVLYFDIPGGLPDVNITGAINEGYTDIFGCKTGR